MSLRILTDNMRGDPIEPRLALVDDDGYEQTSVLLKDLQPIAANIAAERARGIAQFAERFYPGDVLLYECDICGNIEWNSTTQSTVNRFTIKRMEYACPRCSAVQNQAPEIFAWVANTVLYHKQKVVP